MNEKPSSPAELLRNAGSRLTRYRDSTGTLTTASGHLEDVRTIHNGKGALIFVRPVDGLKDYHMVIATIPAPNPETDELLERIGHGGRITLTGLATVGSGAIPDIEMSSVHTINKTPATPARPRVAEEPRKPAAQQRRWWQLWQRTAPEDHVQT